MNYDKLILNVTKCCIFVTLISIGFCIGYFVALTEIIDDINRILNK